MKNSKGFTFVEIMVSMVILSVVALIVAQLVGAIDAEHNRLNGNNTEISTEETTEDKRIELMAKINDWSEPKASEGNIIHKMFPYSVTFDSYSPDGLDRLIENHSNEYSLTMSVVYQIDKNKHFVVFK